MKKIKIILGTYGYMKNGIPPVDLIDMNSNPIEVSDAEAERLVKLGVAKEVTEIAVEKHAITEETATGYLDAESLEEYTIDELKDLASKLGIEFKSKIKKEELIKLIAATEVDYPVEEDAEDEEADNEEPPVLSAVEPE
mgnify:CR=1 FL=1